MKYALISLLIFMLPSCTMSFQTIETQGRTSDLIDENQSATPTISPTITVPVSAVP